MNAEPTLQAPTVPTEPIIDKQLLQLSEPLEDMQIDEDEFVDVEGIDDEDSESLFISSSGSDLASSISRQSWIPGEDVQQEQQNLIAPAPIVTKEKPCMQHDNSLFHQIFSQNNGIDFALNSVIVSFHFLIYVLCK